MNLKIPLIQDIKNKIVLVRVDYNVPLKKLDNSLIVADNLKIKDSLNTIKFLQKHQAKIILMSHLKRPNGQVVPTMSLQPVAKYLIDQLKLPVTFSPDCIGQQTQALINKLQPSTILLLENLRFHPQEEQNDEQFAQQLAQLAEVYINDAFPTAHRAHASTVGVTKFLPSFAGLNLLKEVRALSLLIEKPVRPFVIIVGGAKISDKIGALQNLLTVADTVLVGGGVANNFLKAEGLEIHQSYLQDTPADSKKKGINFVKMADDLIAETKTEKTLINDYIPLPKIIYPLDVIAAHNPDSTHTEIIDLWHDMADRPADKNLMYLDIGPKTIKLYSEIIANAQTIFWNGPVGYYENSAFAAGTLKLAQAVAKATTKAKTADKTPTTSIIGGGDTIAAIQQFGLTNKFSHISTAGGAGLTFLAGEPMPGLLPLIQNNHRLQTIDYKPVITA